ncbi:MAG: sensor histidine kinase, partial [Firmicutes bacterium]|nr:sensor histidine kinase [Bacillota bacterium]
MADIIRKTALVGFVFGILFVVLAFTAKLPFYNEILWTIPLASAVLSAIGGVVAAYVSTILQTKMLATAKTTQIFSFLAAAAVNLVIVGIILHLFNYNVWQRDIVASIFLGLAMGAIYGGYQLRLDYLQERMKFLEELTEKNQQLQITTRRLAITEERNRMGRDLHDSISQGLHGLIFTLHSLRHELANPPEKVATIIHHLEATARSTLDELRTMIEELKPSALAEQGLQEAVKAISELLSQRHALPVDVHIDIATALPPAVEMAIYRIIQEALANIEKHAQAHQVTIRISQDETRIIVIISDDGKGFSLQNIPLGNGLRNMQHRTEELDGSFQIISKPALGTSIKALFPSKG